MVGARLTIRRPWLERLPIAPAWAILLLGLALRAGWVLTLDDRLIWDDEGEYVAIARSLAAGEGYVATSYRRNPVLPAYLALAFRVFGDGYLAPRLGQALLGAATGVVLYRIGATAVSPAAGIVTGLLYAVYPAHVYVAGVFYPTCVATFLLALAVLLATREPVRPGGLGRAGACGVLVGLAALALPTLLVVGPGIILAWLTGRPRLAPRRVAACAALVGGAAMAILPWTLQNHARYGRFVLISSGSGVTLWKGNNELADGGPDDRFLDWGRAIWSERLAALDGGARREIEAKYEPIRAEAAARERQTGDYYLALDAILARVARDYMRAHPGVTLRRCGRRLVTLFSAFSRTHSERISARGTTLAAITFYPVLALALFGMVFGLGRAPALAAPMAVVVSVTMVYTVMTSCTRFRLPLDPFLLLFAAVALHGARAWGSGANAVREPVAHALALHPGRFEPTLSGQEAALAEPLRGRDVARRGTSAGNPGGERT
jgi:hypothetical protein